MKKIKRYLFILLSSTLIFSFIGCDRDVTGCLAEGTNISTPTGEKLIENLQIGDEIYSYDMYNQKYISSKVLLIKKYYRDCYQLRTADGIQLTATLTHPIYSPQTGKYELVEKWFNKELNSFAIMKQNNNFINTATQSVKPIGKKVVYDITVESPHANFIANSFLVHNKTPEIISVTPINDLEVIGRSDSSLTLHWTVPGDTALFPVMYDMRYSDSGLHYNMWTQCDSVASMPTPSSIGTRDTVEVKGLQSTTKYWINIRMFGSNSFYSDPGNEVIDSTM